MFFIDEALTVTAKVADSDPTSGGKRSTRSSRSWMVRDDVVVIAVGYTTEIAGFIAVNTGPVSGPDFSNCPAPSRALNGQTGLGSRAQARFTTADARR